MAQKLSQDELARRAQGIELLLLDVDGVLTDGSIVYSDHGEEFKRFHVRDGAGIKLWASTGKKIAIVSGRKSAAVLKRASELGITNLLQGRNDKGNAFRELLDEFQLRAEQVCAIGDDLPDLEILGNAGISVAVADACPEVKAAAHYVTMIPGGQGAVRETIEWLLTLQGQWSKLIARFRPAG